MRGRLVLAVLVMSLGCSRAAPTNSVVAGEWVLDEASRYRLPIDIRSIEPHLLLQVDGRFVATSLPGGMVFLGTHPRLTVVSGEGFWEIGTFGGDHRLLLKFRAITGIGAVESTTALDIASRDAAMRLWWWVGDPDAGARIDFKRN